jgi:hypothetical protein
MKFLFLFALVPALALAYEDTRLCPEGYHYLGDDLPLPETRDLVVEEVGRTEVYSCYKLVQDSQINWLSASHACQEEDAQLVSFEQAAEMDMARMYPGAQAQNVLSSGMKFSDGWYWVGSNVKLASDDDVTEGDNDNSGSPAHPQYDEDCLAFAMSSVATLPADDETTKDSHVLTAVPCSIASPHFTAYMCEARVQTVTYRTWFSANWLDFTLTALIVILFVALCVTLCCFPSSSRPSAYEQQRRQQQQQQRRARSADTAVTSKPPSYDMPPAYDSAVAVHYPSKDADTNKPVSMVDHMRSKSKELVAKVYYYKTPAANNQGASNSRA